MQKRSFRRPKKKDRWYSRTQEKWQTLSQPYQAKLADAGRIEESPYGELNPVGPCNNCSKRDLTCKTYTLQYQTAHGATSKCALCRVNDWRCLPVDDKAASITNPKPVGLETKDTTPDQFDKTTIWKAPQQSQGSTTDSPSTHEKFSPEYALRLEKEVEILDKENEQLNADIERLEQGKEHLDRNMVEAKTTIYDQAITITQLNKQHEALRDQNKRFSEAMRRMETEMAELNRTTSALRYSNRGWRKAHERLQKLHTAIPNNDHEGSDLLRWANKKLESSNEELRASNKKLLKQNKGLVRSNSALLLANKELVESNSPFK